MSTWQYPPDDGMLARVATDVDYMVKSDDNLVGVNTVGGPVTIMLPSALSVEDGRSFLIKDEGGDALANPITIETEGPELIDGVATAPINSNYGSKAVYAAGGTWFSL